MNTAKSKWAISKTALLLAATFLLPFTSPSMAATLTAGTAVVVIEGATEDNLISDVGEFRITDATAVISQAGDSTYLQYVRLPVKARLTYEASDTAMPNALKIEVLESLRRKTGRDPNIPE